MSEPIVDQMAADKISVPKKKRRRKVWSKAQRAAILAKTGGCCYSCGLALALTDDWWLEHIVPFAHGGSESFENLLPSCKLCNHVRLHHKAQRFHLLLTVGDAMLREMDKDTPLGRQVRDSVIKREAKRQRSRKYPGLALRSLVVDRSSRDEGCLHD